MNHATMYVNAGVEVNLARAALGVFMSDADARVLIPDEGGFIANLFNNERDQNVGDWIEAIHGAVHENRERYRRHERERLARARGEVICERCGGQGEPRTARGTTSWGNSYEEDVCRFCGAPIE